MKHLWTQQYCYIVFTNCDARKKYRILFFSRSTFSCVLDFYFILFFPRHNWIRFDRILSVFFFSLNDCTVSVDTLIVTPANACHLFFFFFSRLFFFHTILLVISVYSKYLCVSKRHTWLWKLQINNLTILLCDTSHERDIFFSPLFRCFWRSVGGRFRENDFLSFTRLDSIFFFYLECQLSSTKLFAFIQVNSNSHSIQTEATFEAKFVNCLKSIMP